MQVVVALWEVPVDLLAWPLHAFASGARAAVLV